jgi:glycosyltransferase involved in cell wall biosynthesis
MSSPQVSIVLPTYNRRQVLSRAIESVLAQSMADFELIVVDDNSTDGTREWLATLTDPRLRLLHRKTRSGAAAARNAGIRAAQAELIAFQDSDDEWLPRKLETQLALMRANPACGWIGGSYHVGQHTIRSQALIDGNGYELELLTGEPFVTPAWLVRRECLFDCGLFDESMPCLEDWDLIFKLASRYRFRAVDEVVLIRHASADSLFGDTAKRRAGLEVILGQHRQYFLPHPLLYARWCTELGRLHGLFREVGKSRDILLEGLRHRPLEWRAGMLLLAGLVSVRLLARLSRSRLITMG